MSFREALRLLVRRASALVALAGILVGSVERFLPDVHDGGGRATQLVAGDIDHGTATSAPTDLPPGPVDHHKPHVDHCAHAHGLATSSPARTAVAVAIKADPIDTASDDLASVSIPPHQRPPIA